MPNSVTYVRRWFWTICLLLAGMVLPAQAVEKDTQGFESDLRRYWAAEVARDYDAVYDMLGASDKQKRTREGFVKWRKEDGPWTYLKADVLDVAVEGNLAWAHL